MNLIRIKLLIFLSVWTVQSCHLYKANNIDKKVESSDDNKVNVFKIDTTCIYYSIEDCQGLFNCHYTNFLNTTYPFIFTKIDKANDIGDFLECAVKINKLNDSFYVRTNIALTHYFMAKYMKAVKSKGTGSPLISGVNIQFNRFYRILYDWNCKESFEICVLYMGKNWHDSMGHGDCTNVGFEFFNEIVLPKIKSVDGLDFWTYFDRNNKEDHGPADCYDSFYDAIYKMIKKAWEEGKIELHAPEIK